jgi:DNA-binding transcriptional regulator YiaG
MNRGCSNGMCKLSPDEIRELRSLRQSGVSGVVVARKFGVSPATVSLISRGLVHAST